ncbi:MAG: hypothetical protein A2Y77_13035 [Planctomycetes bacterium RBG_13_62_9]|nr:MAG: hypothetical protein A2Y77_13035 [Planctomycetes bacterium RBG_13_62_9]
MNSAITCPNCQSQIEITEVISSQLRATIRGELETELNAIRQRLKQQQDELAEQQRELEKKAGDVEEQVRARLAQERQSLERKIREQMHVDLKDRDDQLNELRGQLKTSQEKELAIRKKEREIEQVKSQLDQQRLELEQDLKKKLDDERAELVRQAQCKVREELDIELKDKTATLTELQAKVQQAGQKELAFLKEKRDLEERIRNVELEVTRRTQEELKKVREQALKELDEQHRLKLLEKEQQVEALRRQIDDLKRSAEQGSQQAQGEVLEVALEELLKDLFPTDSIDPVAKGVRGADVIQRVFDENGMDCGVILWESKRTRHWSKEWLPKLRDDLRVVKASRSVLVSEQLPEHIRHFGQVDGVWVVSWGCVHPVAMALREGLIAVARGRRALEGQHSKMEIVYNYLIGQEFYNRVSGIAEAFMTMRQDLEAEKRTYQRCWAKREKQLERVVISTSGLYGDLQGIIGSTLPEIKGMSLAALDSDGLPSGKALTDGEQIDD